MFSEGLLFLYCCISLFLLLFLLLFLFFCFFLVFCFLFFDLKEPPFGKLLPVQVGTTLVTTPLVAKTLRNRPVYPEIYTTRSPNESLVGNHSGLVLHLVTRCATDAPTRPTCWMAGRSLNVVKPWLQVHCSTSWHARRLGWPAVATRSGPKPPAGPTVLHRY